MTSKLHLREWTTRVDRAAWGDGAWVNEPDKIQWVDEATNLDCLMHRHPSAGHWCGYVGVAEGHPAFGKGYDDVDASAHGGLTYAKFCQETADESKGICHVPAEGRPHRVWWLGFDCAHSGDLSPGTAALYRDRGWESGGLGFETYKSRAFVEQEIEALAKQLAAGV